MPSLFQQLPGPCGRAGVWRWRKWLEAAERSQKWKASWINTYLPFKTVYSGSFYNSGAKTWAVVWWTCDWPSQLRCWPWWCWAGGHALGAGGGASLAIRTATSPVKEPHKGVGEWLLCLFLNDTTRVDGERRWSSGFLRFLSGHSRKTWEKVKAGTTPGAQAVTLNLEKMAVGW